MTTELNTVLDYWEHEKGIKRDVLIEAVRGALLSASKKSIGPANELRIDIDPDNGSIKAYATLEAVERVVDPYREIELNRARRAKADAELGDMVEVEVTPRNFGRIAAQAAKQAMMQRIRQAEKELIFDEFKDRAGEVVAGTVRRFERSDVIIDLGRYEAIMPSRERVPTEDYNVGDRLRAYVVAVESGARGPEIILSRSHPNFVRRLFEMEVSEIADRTVEIRGIAREAGYRTKVAVYSKEDKVDPVGACVGMRGQRVKNIVRELNNEKVDIIRWSQDIPEFVIDALKPAQINSIEVDSEKKAVLVKVDEEQLSLAIGRRGQNARLTSKLLGWDVNITRDETATEMFDQQMAEAISLLENELAISRDRAQALVGNGINSIDTVLALEADDIADALEISQEEAQKIREAASEASQRRLAT